MCVREYSMLAPHRWNVRCLIRCLWVVSWVGAFNFSGLWSLAAQTEPGQMQRRMAEAEWRWVAKRRKPWIPTNSPPQFPHSICPNKAHSIQLKATIVVWHRMTSDKITEEMWNMNYPHTNYCGIKWKPSCNTIRLWNMQPRACFRASLGNTACYLWLLSETGEKQA